MDEFILESLMEEEKMDMKSMEKDAKNMKEVKMKEDESDFDNDGDKDDDLFDGDFSDEDFDKDDDFEDDTYSEDTALMEAYEYLLEADESEKHEPLPEQPEKKEKTSGGIKDSIKNQIQLINNKLGKLAPSSQSAKALKEKRKKLRARLTLSK